MFKKKNTSDPRKIDTFIGKDTFLSGTLDAKGTIRIDGEFEGEIMTQSDVIIGAGARVKAQVKGKNVTLGGKLQGNVTAENKLEILNNGELFGDIQTQMLTIEEGGYFYGLCNMSSSSGEPSLERIELKGRKAELLQAAEAGPDENGAREVRAENNSKEEDSPADEKENKGPEKEKMTHKKDKKKLKGL